MRELTDTDLMLAVKAEELDKLTGLFDRYHPALYRFFFYHIRQQQMAEDCTQNVFYRVLKYRHSYKPQTSVKAWLYQIARNVLNDELKQQRKHRYDHDCSIPDDRQSGATADGKLKEKERLRLLEEALGQLAPADRDILILSRYQQLRYHEIAEILQLSEAAVKVRVHRAFRQLQSFYSKKGAL